MDKHTGECVNLGAWVKGGNKIPNTYTMVEDGYKNIWIGTMGSGLFRYSLLTGELTQYKMLVDNTVVYPYQILRNPYVRVLLVHGDFLYVGTADGLEVFTLSKGGDIRLRGRFMLKSSVRDMKVDADGVLWAATTLGLVRFDIANESVKTYTVEDGLPINSTCSVEIASDGKIWVSTDDGLRHSVAAQLIQIGQSAFRTGQQDDISFHQFVRIVGVEQVYTRIALQDIEVGEIT